MLLKTNVGEVRGAKVLALPPSFLKETSFSKNDRVVHFESLTKWYECMSYETPSEHSCSGTRGEESFRGTDSWEAYLRILKEGDQSIIDLIKKEHQKEVKNIKDTYEIEQILYKRDVTGCFFDVSDVLNNVPECWIEEDVEQKETPTYNMVINMGALGGVSQRHMATGVAKCLAIASVLEELGVMVSITLLSVADGHGAGKVFVFCELKSPDIKMNYQKVSALANVSFLRRGAWRVRELVDQHSDGGSYSSIYDIKGAISVTEQEQITEFKERVFGELNVRKS